MTSTGPQATLAIQSPILLSVPRLVHGFSTRAGGVSTAFLAANANGTGDLNLGYSELDDRENVRTNRGRWLRALDIDESLYRFALLRQEHSAVVRAIRTREEAATDFAQPGTLPGDGLVTDVPGVLLTIQTADCVPVLLCDPVRRAIGAFHAGWRGTFARIVQHGIETMQALYGSETANMHAAIGPSIGPGSYVVSDELKQQFAGQFDDAETLFRTTESHSGDRQTCLDLWKANRDQLLRSGVPEGNIDVLGLDTAADTSRFFSYRAERGRTGRMMSSIGLRTSEES